MKKMKELASEERFEDALALRNRLSSFARGVSRGQRIRAITRIPEILVRVEDELLLIRYGRLASSAQVPRVELLEETISSLLLSGERIEDDESIIPAKNYEESEKLVRVLEKVSEVLIIDESRGPWSMPTRGATSIRHRLLDMVVAANDLAYIDMLWDDWSPGFDGGDAVAATKNALRDPANLAAALGYYRATLGEGKKDPALADLQARMGSEVPPQPLLYLHGVNDGCIGREVADFAAGIAPANVDVRIVEGAGHFLQLEQPRAVAEHVLGWIS